MRVLFGIAFAILIALELSILGIVVGVVGMFFPLLWERSPVKAAVAAVLLVVGAVALWRSWRRPATGQVTSLHPGISVSHIPISGAVGAIYMAQFVVWAILAPAVSVFYAVLLGGGLLLVPLAYYVNRPGQGGATRTGCGGLLGLVSGLLLFGVVSSRQMRLAGLFTAAVVAGVLGAGVLIWLRRRPQHPTIAPYTE